MRVSRWVLLLELVVCFLPITIGWMIGGAVIGMVGPIGLFLALRAVRTGMGLRSRTLGIAMIAGLVAYAVASVALRLVGGPGAYAATVDFIVLIVMLPAVGTAHLMYLATPASPRLVPS